ncbi:hypothetical protein NFI96_019554 [Prochilodus magdalenae]|nr:hypothetical protein NFI96_019554 [Prochilodus magdalenae]
MSNTSIIKFADDTTVIGLITGGDETAYRREVAELVDWCDYNNLSLNTDKTKEMIVDPRRRRRELHTPLFIGGTEVERVKTFKFLGVHISEDLTWSHNTHYIVRKSQQRLYFLRRLRKFGMSAQILSNFYRSTIESVLTSSITVWYDRGPCLALCTKAPLHCHQRAIKTLENLSDGSSVKSRSMGVSKQLSNDLKTKIVHCHGLGEGYRKLTWRFQHSVSTVRNIVRKWKTTGTVQVKARSGRPRKISNKQKRRMLRTVRVNPQTSTKDLQHDLAADGVTVHRSTIRRTLHKEMLYERVMQRKPFLRPHHKQSRLKYASFILEKGAVD